MIIKCHSHLSTRTIKSRTPTTPKASESDNQQVYSLVEYRLVVTVNKMLGSLYITKLTLNIWSSNGIPLHLLKEVENANLPHKTCSYQLDSGCQNLE